MRLSTVENARRGARGKIIPALVCLVLASSAEAMPMELKNPLKSKRVQAILTATGLGVGAITIGSGIGGVLSSFSQNNQSTQQRTPQVTQTIRATPTDPATENTNISTDQARSFSMEPSRTKDQPAVTKPTAKQVRKTLRVLKVTPTMTQEELTNMVNLDEPTLFISEEKLEFNTVAIRDKVTGKVRYNRISQGSEGSVKATEALIKKVQDSKNGSIQLRSGKKLTLLQLADEAIVLNSKDGVTFTPTHNKNNHNYTEEIQSEETETDTTTPATEPQNP